MFYQRNQSLDLKVPFPTAEEINRNLKKTWKYLRNKELHTYNNPSPKCRKAAYRANSEPKILAPQMLAGIGQFYFFISVILSQGCPDIIPIPGKMKTGVVGTTACIVHAWNAEGNQYLSQWSL